MSQRTALAPAARALPVAHLDALRAGAALAVCLWHWRNLWFQDLPRHDGLLWRAGVYYLTGFGHEAVMVFFVLSGFFITGSILKAREAGRWAWRDYLLNRLTRLAIVLWPALALGAAWDLAGLRLFSGASLYDGAAHWGRVILNYPVAGRLDWATALGNALFLQEIRVHPLGSNGPLWSLAYEFWYYLLFPLAFFALARGTPPLRRALSGLGALAVAWLIGPWLLGYFLIWLMGAAIAGLHCRGRLPRTPAWVGLVALVAFAAAATVGRLQLIYPVLKPDLLTGAAFSALLVTVLGGAWGPAGGRYARMSGGLAGFSYTLYLVHMPFLVFWQAAVLHGQRWAPTPPTLLLGLLPLGATVAYAYGVSRLTEAHTERLRRAIARRWLAR